MEMLYVIYGIFYGLLLLLVIYEQLAGDEFVW
jgi:hypothetical protein